MKHPLDSRVFRTSLLIACAVIPLSEGANAETRTTTRPNILVAISDDQSFAHTSAAGYKAVRTPSFDRIAREGVMFRNGFAASPGCSPSRASLLTGRHTWQIEDAGTHLSGFPEKYPTYPDLLEADGYAVGYTGKGWGPGNWQVSGRTRNPAGPEFNRHKLIPPATGMSKVDYAANFQEFLATREDGQPFCFWFGASEPHTDYEKGSGLKAGKRLEDVVVPGFLPDSPEVRGDILDYCLEIEWFDTQLGKMLQLLEAAGELDNTMVIVTSDNGMPFPRAKATCYEYGIHMPLAIRWPARVPGARTVDDLVGCVDLTATILEAAAVRPPQAFPISGRSIMNILQSQNQGRVDAVRNEAWAARERHTSARHGNLGYPQRALRTPQFLYIRNLEPDRWPMGDPREIMRDGSLGPENAAFHDIDFGHTRRFMVENQDRADVRHFLQLAVAKKPAEELYDIVKDPDCLNNLADIPEFKKTKQELSDRMSAHLKETGDPRALGKGEIWESYRRYSNLRNFPPPPTPES